MMGCDSDHIGLSLNMNKDSPQSLQKNMPTNFDFKFYFSKFLEGEILNNVFKILIIQKYGLSHNFT